LAIGPVSAGAANAMARESGQETFVCKVHIPDLIRDGAGSRQENASQQELKAWS
jgi:hypothetical protein